MSQQPIRNKLNQLASAPTPQNTPASLTGSYLKNNPIVPSTIDEEAEIKKNLSNNPAFLSMIQGKLGTLIGKDSGYIDSLSPKIKNRIYSLKSVQADQMKLEEEFQKELLELERKFYKKYEPLYKHRSEIINGDVEPTDLEIENGKKIEAELEGDEEDDVEEEEKDDVEDEEKDEVKGIPNFWLTALENLHPISETITDRDSEVLSYLNDIKLEYLSKPGFKLIFKFNENPFFTNKSLSKTYYYQEELGYSGDFIYDHAEGDEIKWKSQEENVTISIERRKQRNKHTKQTRTIEKLTPTESFFNFFDPPKAPSDGDEKHDHDDDEDEDDHDDEDEDLEERLALDYQLGEEIKDKLIPRAVDWFTGSAVDYGLEDEEEFGEGDEFDEEDEEDESNDDDDDDDSEDDDQDDSKTKSKQQPPECKQS